MPVHFAGHPCDMDAILALARERRPAGDRGRGARAAGALPRAHVGTLGTLTAFSFYATKNLTTGEGGMLVTTRRRAAPSGVRMRRLHGISRDAWKRYSGDGHLALRGPLPGLQVQH